MTCRIVRVFAEDRTNPISGFVFISTSKDVDLLLTSPITVKLGEKHSDKKIFMMKRLKCLNVLSQVLDPAIHNNASKDMLKIS